MERSPKRFNEVVAMNELRLLCSLFLFVFLVFACPKYASSAEIEGLGPFKLAKTTISIMKQLEKELKTKCTIATTFEQQVQSYNKKLVLSLGAALVVSQCSNVKELTIREYYIGEFKVDSLSLTFLNDILFSTAIPKGVWN